MHKIKGSLQYRRTSLGSRKGIGVFETVERNTGIMIDMGIFKSKEEKQLDSIIQRLQMNMSNNYKDNAQDNLRELEKTLKDMRSAGNIRTKVIEKYELILDDYKEKMKDFRHKDQKPYWH